MLPVSRNSQRRRSALIAAAVLVLAPLPAGAQAPVATRDPASPSVATGPVPAWVAAAPPLATTTSDAAFVLSLLDQQFRLDPGRQQSFRRSIVRIQRPEALAAFGTVTLTWDPATDVVTVHRLAIHRGGTVIDVLASQSFEILRRENRLEQQMFNGQLTAVLTLADLRVGDELHIETSIATSNPLIGDHVEDAVLAPAGLSIGQWRVLASWPANRAVTWRAGPGLPAPVVDRVGADRRLTINARDFRAPEPPAGAPGRFGEINLLRLSDFGDWAAVADAMRPLYDAAAVLTPGSPLAMEADRIAAASADPAARALAALQLVQRDVRYVANVAGLGGYRPNAAEAVWRDRFGDCKGKTVVLLALLRQLGITAEPALVAVQQSDGLDRSLPAPGRFDHVLVRATIGGRQYWLDGTRSGDTVLPTGIDMRWALPLASRTLVAVAPAPLTAPLEDRTLEVDASAGLWAPATAKGEVVLRGDEAQGTMTALALMTAEQRTEAVQAYWRRLYSDVTIDTVDSRVDSARGEVRLSFAGRMPSDWIDADSGKEEASASRLGRDLAPKREPGPFADVPVARPRSWLVTRQRIRLPQGGRGFWVDGEAIATEVAGVRYERESAIKDGVFVMAATTRMEAGELDLAAAKAADKETDRLFEKRLYLRFSPDSYELTAADRAARGKLDSAATPRDRAIAAARAAIEAEDYAKALTQLDAAEALAPADRESRGLRILALRHAGRDKDYQAALAATVALFPRDAWLLREQAEMLVQANRSEDALIVLDRLLLIDPGDALNHRVRARARRLAGDYAGAASDLATAISLDPGNRDPHVARVNVLRQAGRYAEALAAIDAALARFAGDDWLRATRVEMLARLGRGAEARAAADQLVREADSALARMARADNRLSGGAAAELDDVVAAIRLNPTNGWTEATIQRVLAVPGAYPRLLQAFDTVLATAKDKEAVGRYRDELVLAGGAPAEALAVLNARLTAEPKAAWPYNERCWYRATRAIELDMALADCDEAVKRRPVSAFYDSRALVWLQKRDWARARADYDLSLKDYPRQPSSLYGRSLVRQQQGDVAGAAADLAAARALAPTIDEEWATYRLPMPLPSAPALPVTASGTSPG